VHRWLGVESWRKEHRPMISLLFPVTMLFGIGIAVWDDRDERGIPVRILSEWSFSNQVLTLSFFLSQIRIQRRIILFHHLARRLLTGNLRRGALPNRKLKYVPPRARARDARPTRVDYGNSKAMCKSFVYLSTSKNQPQLLSPATRSPTFLLHWDPFEIIFRSLPPRGHPNHR